jgi:hypothetical protein
VWDPDTHSNIGTPLGSVTELNHLNDPQHRLEENLPSYTNQRQPCTNPECQVLCLFTFYTTHKESACCSCFNNLCYLPVPGTPCTNQMHCPSRNYTRITYQQYYQRVSSQGVMVGPKHKSNYFTNLWTAVSSFMFIVQGRNNLPIGNISSYSSIGFQC